MPTTREEMHELADELLVASVREATGNSDATPRPGQTRLMHDILDTMLGSYSTTSKIPGHHSGKAGTGSGKSFAAGVPAVIVAMEKRERTVISTESLSLQSQIIDKDAPTIARAALGLWDWAPKTAVLKGWSNFGCAARATSAAHDVLGTEANRVLPHGESRLLSELADQVDALVAAGPEVVFTATGRVSRSRAALASMDMIPVDGLQLPREEFLKLLSWVLRESSEYDTEAHPGDKHSYNGMVRDHASWSAVSVSPAECPGVDSCPFGDVCRPAAGRAKAAAADIVVTNHSMLAVQAAVGAPVVVGNRKLGVFRHIVMDEAHGLASNVRNQGAKAISGRRITDVRKTFERVMGIDDDANKAAWTVAEKSNSKLADRADGLADLLDGRLTALAALAGRKESVYKVPRNDDPLDGDIAEQILVWLARLNKEIPQPKINDGMKAMLALRRAHAKVEALIADISAARNTESGAARWIEPAVESDRVSKFTKAFIPATLKVSPVDVSGMLRTNLYTSDVLAERDDEEQVYVEDDDGDGFREVIKIGPKWMIPEDEWSSSGNPQEKIPPRYALSVTAISATLPSGFCYEVGLDTQVVTYPTPFTDAYAGSALYVPRAVDPVDVEALKSSWSRDSSRPKFDTARHEQWAADHMETLVRANGGSALVLAAKGESGRNYAARLRETVGPLGIEVYSQWDGMPIGQLVASWRENKHAVLVGTKSLMTGVDAPGDTCSLVILDRIPRAASNPVDDARVEAIMERLDIDRWAADRYVYAATAALLCEQAVGRLIRMPTDRGLVAVLDPRLLKTGPYAYSRASRELYLAALSAFDRRISNPERAIEFITGLREQTAA